MHEEIGRRVLAQPDLLQVALANVAHWKQSGSLSAPMVAELDALLEQPLQTLVEKLTAQSEEGALVRQNSPFAGILSPKEVWQIKARYRDDQNAA